MWDMYRLDYYSYNFVTLISCHEMDPLHVYSWAGIDHESLELMVSSDFQEARLCWMFTSARVHETVYHLTSTAGSSYLPRWVFISSNLCPSSSSPRDLLPQFVPQPRLPRVCLLPPKRARYVQPPPKRGVWLRPALRADGLADARAETCIA